MKKPDLNEKELLNPGEAAACFGLSRRRFFRMLDSEKSLPFVAMYRKRKLIIRTELEEYFRLHPERKEELKNAPIPQKA